MRATLFPQKTLTQAIAVALALPFASGFAYAADFTVNSATTSAKTLGANNTGSITSGGSIVVSGSSVAVTLSGNNATLNKQGVLKQTGTGRVVRDNTGVSGINITNGSLSNANALMQSADADVIQMNKSPASVTLNNYGSLISLNASGSGNQAVDFAAIESGSNIVNNYAGGLLRAYEADAVRPGVNGVVNNWGKIESITTTGSSSDGIDAQNASGIAINNNAGGTIDGGRHGITGGAKDAITPFTMSIANASTAIIRGNNGAGVNLDGFNANQVVSVLNAGLILGNGVSGDGDGADIDGLANITNSGIIRSQNAYSALSAGLAYSEGVSIGGGTVLNSGTIEGLVSAGNGNAVGRGITLAGNDIASGPQAGSREGLYGNATVTNQTGGLIRGQSDSAIVASGLASGYTITINNAAGARIVGGGTSSAAILTNADRTVIVNAGTIDGSSSGKAIQLGSANNQVSIVGGSASVLGSINGGSGGNNTLTLDPGTGNQFNYAGTLSNFAKVEQKSGSVTLSGVSDYTGSTVISGGTLTLDGANRLSASSALELAGGNLNIVNAGGANGQTFSQLSLTASSTLALNGTSVTFNSLGNVASAATLQITDFQSAASPTYAIRLLGSYAANADFQTLVSHTTINGIAARYSFDGTYTNIAAVPEPETYAMFLAGLGLLVARRRRV